MSDSLFSSAGGLDPEVVEAARDELRRRLPELRELPGFPIGSDEDILKMSVPPYYTACPNPFIQDWLEQTNPKGYDDREYVDPGPFAADVTAGTGSIVYKAHSYPTKVPHEAIVRFLLHYTRPGDVVLDGFSGTGMTGVAAQVCARPSSELRASVEAEMGAVEWGARRSILQDLSPLASFIAAGLNLPIDPAAFEAEANRLLNELAAEWGWMYETTIDDGSTARIDYTVWSQVFSCPACGSKIIFHTAAFDEETGGVADEFSCHSCGVTLTRRDLEDRTGIVHSVVGDATERVLFEPVRIGYRVRKQKFEKSVDQSDLDVLTRARESGLPFSVPTGELPYMHRTHYKDAVTKRGIGRVHHFFPDRSLIALSVLWAKATDVDDPLLRTALVFWVEQAVWGLSWMNRYSPTHYSQVNRFMSGMYYMASLVSECSPWYNLEGSTPSRGKLSNLAKMWASVSAAAGRVMVSTGSSTSLGIGDNTVDYVFVDPPFGHNKYYSDLAYLNEAWHGVESTSDQEAIVNESKVVPRTIDEYQDLMSSCFTEFFRVLKPGRWMTVEFSNSKSSVWLSIQEALSQAGFVTADTRVFDKKTGTFQQLAAKNAVKRDLIISAYKPSAVTEERFGLVAGSPEGAWEFVREHLSHLPVSGGKRGEARAVRERMADRLYDRMVAYHVHRSVTVPLTAGEFYAGMEQRFPVRDDMYFLPEQVEGYERHRMTVKELVQAELFITNEQSAVQWLRQFLKRKPSAYADIQPAFFSELQAGLPEWEALPELRDLLEGSFLQDDQGRWYVPDPKKTEDLEKLRTRALLKEFDAYREGKGKLDRFRSEAVRAGFKEAWARRDFATIITVGKRLPEDAFVEDEALLYYYDNARRLASS